MVGQPEVIVDDAQMPAERLVHAVKAEHRRHTQVGSRAHRELLVSRRASLRNARRTADILLFRRARKPRDEQPLEDYCRWRDPVRGQRVLETFVHRRRHSHGSQEARADHPGAKPWQDLVRQLVPDPTETERIEHTFAGGLGIGDGKEWKCHDDRRSH